jgi:hypothetical protein
MKSSSGESGVNNSVALQNEDMRDGTAIKRKMSQQVILNSVAHYEGPEAYPGANEQSIQYKAQPLVSPTMKQLLQMSNPSVSDNTVNRFFDQNPFANLRISIASQSESSPPRQ